MLPKPLPIWPPFIRPVVYLILWILHWPITWFHGYLLWPFWPIFDSWSLMMSLTAFPNLDRHAMCDLLTFERSVKQYDGIWNSFIQFKYLNPFYPFEFIWIQLISIEIMDPFLIKISPFLVKRRLRILVLTTLFDHHFQILEITSNIWPLTSHSPKATWTMHLLEELVDDSLS